MAKTISVALAAHYAQGSTTISRQARIQRQDGLVLLGTTCAHNLLISGELYLSKYGTNPMAISQKADASVTNSQLQGFLSDVVTEADLAAGLWDNASYTLFDVNYRDLTMGTMNLMTGSLGEVTAGRSVFSAELRGISQSLQNTVGVLYTQLCTATLGDARCKVNLASYTSTGAVTSVTDLATFTDTSRTDALNWFTYGKITFTSGLNVGLSMEIQSFAAGGAFKLALPMPYTIAVGDTYSAVAGCNKALKGNMARTGSITFPNFGGYIQYDATLTAPTNFYAGGSILWTSGANSGTGQTIAANSAGQLLLATAPSNPSVVGDQFVISPPASQLYTGDCKVKFSNVVNNRGFNEVPGADLVLGLGGTTGEIQ